MTEADRRELRRMDDARMAILETQMQQVIKNQDDGRRETLDWRANFSAKLDRAIDVMTNRPCVKHEEKLKNVDTIGSSIWTLILTLVPILATTAYFIVTMHGDVEHLKATSFGYRGIKVVTDERP